MLEYQLPDVPTPISNFELVEPVATDRVVGHTFEYRPSYLEDDDPSIEIKAYVSTPEFSDPDATLIIVPIGFGEGLAAAKQAAGYWLMDIDENQTHQKKDR